MQRKHPLRIIFTVLLTASLFLLSTATAFASINYPTYTVKKGDTLWIIATKFYTSISSLYTANNLKSDQLTVGQKIKVTQTDTYRVATGDTPYKIAKRFNISLSELLSVNNIIANNLRIGQQLQLPGIIAYRVWTHDTLYLLAREFKVSINQLISLNQLTSSDIKPGQKLYIPITNSTPAANEETRNQVSEPTLWKTPRGTVLYHVQPEDSLSTIAEKYKTTVDAIKKTNNLKLDLILPGDPLFVPYNNSKPVYGIKVPSVKVKPGFGELLDWEYARWIINPGSTATVEDLQTKKEFQVYRIGGSNHADCEPLTAQDTELMKKIFGDTWSWSTRPVLVRYSGRVIAASMAGQPHAFDTIPDNNFDGMFDLHFLNSRTHNTNSVDSKHQASVQKAAGN